MTRLLTLNKKHVCPTFPRFFWASLLHLKLHYSLLLFNPTPIVVKSKTNLQNKFRLPWIVLEKPISAWALGFGQHWLSIKYSFTSIKVLFFAAKTNQTRGRYFLNYYPRINQVLLISS